jgi:hypothetical protein
MADKTDDGTVAPEAEEDAPANDVATSPNEAADPQELVESKVPIDIRDKYEVISYRNAAVILAEARQAEFEEILETLRNFSITTTMIRTAGGNESEIPKLFSAALRPHGWHETVINADLLVRLTWREEVRKTKSGKPVMESRIRTINRERYLDGHKIDYVKGKVAFDLEWNSKDQTFDRDLYAMNAFFLSGAIDVGVLVTRSASMNEVFRTVGPALTKEGEIETLKDGSKRPTIQKYGASTTWMGKLIFRLNAGRNGGCPILAFGITPALVSDWPLHSARSAEA